MKTKLYFFLAFILSLPLAASAQMQEVEMADTLRSNGKIFVVVIIMSIILLGVAAYLFNLDRKISKLEKKD